MVAESDWKFHWVKVPRQRPIDFYKAGFNDARWKKIAVPANWELDGCGLPTYVNQPYEFDGHAKRGAKLTTPFDTLADRKPVKLYREKLIISISWNGIEVFIHPGAV